MRRFLLLLAALVFANVIAAQNDSRLNVRKLELIPNDTEASRAKKKDANGDKCALLKIQTPNMNEAERNRLVVEADRGTFLYPVEAVGELKIFLTEGVKILVFRHPDYGVLTYNVKENVEGNKVYKVVIEADKIPGPIPPNPGITLNSNYVNIKVMPADAIISVDGQFYTKRNIQLTVDEPHALEVSHPLYHTYEQTIYASADKKMSYDVKLAPAFGWLSITSKPENGATVLIDKKRVGVTPFRSDTLKSGEYEVTLLKDMFESVTKTVVVRDNNVGEIEIPMKPTFAEITINTDKDSDIYVDEYRVGTGNWRGRLGDGQHIVEARKASHRSTKTVFDVTAGKPQTITVTAPTPIYGALDITSDPDEAAVYLDGVKIGETPLVQKNILIGSHALRFEKSGCAPAELTATVEEGKIKEVSGKLQTGRAISISTDGTGDKIFVDGKYIGDSPITATLSFGEHEVAAIRGYSGDINALKDLNGGSLKGINAINGVNGVKAVAKTITVSQTGSTTSVQLAFSDNRTFTVNGISFEMIYVKGGTFTMGCTNEQGGDCDGDEKPTHSVTLSDYYIGKFEVTQELWKAVMGKNPSNWKGDKLPVESVSWNDVQKFITKLNQMTGVNFRLPTEAEWEYAARGGNKSRGYKYSGSNNIGDVAWYADNSGDKTHQVGTKTPNELGIYDMSGNVLEWCQDWYGSYSSGSQTNPTGASTGSHRVLRGGSWSVSAGYCRVSIRSNKYPNIRAYSRGFRLVLVP